MAFTPIDPPKRNTKKSPIGYVVRLPKASNSGKRGPGNNPGMIIRIHPATAKKACLHHGTPASIRIGSGDHQGLVQLVPIAVSGNRTIRQGKTLHTSYTYTCPYLGDVANIFPMVTSMAPLHLVEASQENGLLFQLPPRPPAESES